jgi:hypothetical protein
VSEREKLQSKRVGKVSLGSREEGLACKIVKTKQKHKKQGQIRDEQRSLFPLSYKPIDEDIDGAIDP